MISRVNKILNLFALLIFLVELFTPLLLLTDFSVEKNYDGTKLSAVPTSQNQHFYLLAEELDDTERAESNKQLICSLDFDLISAFQLQIEQTFSTLASAVECFDHPTAKPRLFLLYHHIII